MTKITKQTKAFLKLWNNGDIDYNYDWKTLPVDMIDEINHLYNKGYKDAILAYDRMGLEYLYQNSDKYYLFPCIMQIIVNIFPMLEDDMGF